MLLFLNLVLLQYLVAVEEHKRENQFMEGQHGVDYIIPTSRDGSTLFQTIKQARTAFRPRSCRRDIGGYEWKGQAGKGHP